MNLATFLATLSAPHPPDGLPALLAAMWWESHGDWNRAHQIAQDVESRDGAWVHAYLHRKEGNAANAAYWYRFAGHPVSTASFADEWTSIVTHLLAD
jgi:hypothetical protein